MLKLKVLLPVLMIVGLFVCSFFAGRAVAQQPLPVETTAPYAIPKAWGELSDVTQSSVGAAYVFVGTDGTIRLVQANVAGIASVQVIHRR